MGHAVATTGRVGLPMPLSDIAERSWDAVVVGAGHNGLTAAAYLARAGKSVLVLEQRDVIGGACTIEETWPGYRISPCAYLVGLLHPKVVEELDLSRHGYRYTIGDPQLVVPFEDGAAFIEWLDDERALDSIRTFAPDQVKGYQEYRASWARIRATLRPPTDDDVWLGEPPSRDQLEARLGGDRNAIAALFDESMVDHLGRFFGDQRMIDALAGQGVIGTNASPFDAGTASIAFHHSSGSLDGSAGDWGFVAGGMGMVAFTIADAAAEAGAVIAAGVPVARIAPGEGVELESGYVIRARVVVSNADPNRSAALVDDAPADWLGRVEAVPTESPVVKVTYALSALPTFVADLPPQIGMVNVTRGAAALHESYLAARAGGLSDELWCELYFQTAYDSSIAPDGMQVLSAFCQYVPYRFDQGDWDDHRDEVGDRVTASVERFAPGFGELVVHRHIDGPPDLEARLGLTGGHIFHGECLPQYMWDNRLPYRTGIDGLYLCGAGTHPGGSVIAVNGRNAAMAVLADLD